MLGPALSLLASLLQPRLQTLELTLSAVIRDPNHPLSPRAKPKTFDFSRDVNLNSSSDLNGSGTTGSKEQQATVRKEMLALQAEVGFLMLLLGTYPSSASSRRYIVHFDNSLTTIRDFVRLCVHERTSLGK